MKTHLTTFLAAIGCCAAIQTAPAALLNVGVTFPVIAYSSGSAMAVNYTANTGSFTVSGTPGLVRFASSEAPRISTGAKSLQIQVTLDSSGTLVSGAPGTLSISGTVTRIAGGVTNTYTGVLVSGDVLGFGFLENGAVDQYDFRFHVTGGSMASLFGPVAGVTVTSAGSTFNNDFTVDFHGGAQGNAGRDNSDTTPPVITCPDNIIVEGNTNVDGFGGAYVTFPIPAVDDPTATLVFTPTNGSFFALPPGVASSNYPVVVVATDPSGNSSQCSFVITVQDTTGPSFETNNPVISGCDQPLVVTNDPGQCSAAFSFSRPIATDADSGTPIPASASAIDEHGVVIVLTDIGGGLLQGTFPKGSNVITFTASDGRGNSSQAQCAVVVVDKEAPELMCVDQTATFKPIMTNALSCIEADFNNTPIAASNYVWFNSVIKIPSSGGNSSFTVHIFDQTILLAVDNTNITVPVPEAYITFSNGVATASTTFSNGTWITTTRLGLAGNTFASGLAWQTPFSLNNHSGSIWGQDPDNGNTQFRRQVKSASWCGRFAIDKPGVVVQWQWAAAVYTTFTNDLNALGMKPIDANTANPYNNSDHAGTPENFKPYVTGGARGGGGSNWTGSYSATKPANLGMGAVCEGVVNFMTPLAADNCDDSVAVTCDPPSGSVFGPGDHTITCTAVDSSGNSNTCSFTLTVLSPLHVVFDKPDDDNLNDNTSMPDDGFSDMNCPDAPSTTQNVTRFTAGSRIVHIVRILDCNDNDVTTQLAPFITVHIDVTEREGTYYDSFLVTDLTESYTGVGSPGGIMVPVGPRFQYVLDTTGYETQTINNSRFFRSCVWVDYNSSPGIAVGMEDVVLESR